MCAGRKRGLDELVQCRHALLGDGQRRLIALEDWRRNIGQIYLLRGAAPRENATQHKPRHTSEDLTRNDTQRVHGADLTTSLRLRVCLVAVGTASLGDIRCRAAIRAREQSRL